MPALAAFLTLVLAAAPPPRLTKLSIEPARTFLFGPDAHQQLLVTGYFSDGSERDLTAQAVFSPDKPAIVAINPAGVTAARHAGFSMVTARYGGFTSAAHILVLDKRPNDKVSFVRDVEPILMLKGCNGGNCHGSMHGRNGFRLSQFGYDAELDHKMIAQEALARRVNLQDPPRSLLLLKPTSKVPHGGGTRFGADSEEYRVLSKWIAEGAPGPQNASDVRLNHIEVFPGERVMPAPGAEQRLLVLGHYTDRTIRDVTAEVTFTPKDPSIATVDGAVIKAHRPGETSILVRASGTVGLARVAVLSGRPVPDYPQVAGSTFIDTLVFDKLKRLHIPPAGLCSDEVFLRRAFLDAIGTLPATEEVRAFLADQAPDKRTKLIDNLLARPEYAEYWGLIWADLLTITAFKSGPSHTLYLDQWLREQLRANVPFDKFARELVAGTGSIREEPGIALVVSRPPEQAASYFSQLLLGVRIQCAQCHDHPFEKWRRGDYFGMVAFFSQVSTRQYRNATLIYDDLSKQTTDPVTGLTAQPRVLGGTALVQKKGASARQMLAGWITAPENPYFSRAIANRIWAHYMKVGLVEPVDDFRETNPATNPQLLNALAKHFIESGYNLKTLMRTIMNSRVYQLSSATNEFNQSDDQHYSHYYMRRLYAEPLLDAITALTGAAHKFRFGYAGMKAVELHDPVIPEPFLQTFDRNRRETTCERGENITLGQTMALISGDAINAKLRSRGGTLDRLLDSSMSDRDIIGELYLSALCRRPNADESSQLLDAVQTGKSRREGLEDVLWALVNSREFLFNH